MSDQVESRMQEIQAQFATRDQLQRELTEAQEALNREAYRLETTELRFEMAQEEIRALESLTPAGILSSILGTKASKIDACREECQNLEREHRECVQAVETLQQQVERLTGELSGFAEVEVEFQALSAADPGAEADDLRRFERAIEAGESLLNQLSGTYKLCSRLRNGPNMLRCGAVLTAATRVWGSRVAGGVAGQVAGSVRHFCKKLAELELNPESGSDAEILAASSQLERFTDPTCLGADAQADGWAELEALTRGLVSDLQERLAHLAPRRC